MKNILISTMLFLTMAYSYEGKAVIQQIPLFESKEPIELSLTSDLVTLMDDKSEEPEYIPATLIQYLPEYQIRVFDIKVKARGKTRRLSDLCDFPPLKFNLKKSQLKDSDFEGQEKLKFVSQCRQEEEFQNYLLEEYLLYQTYSLLTEESYKTRLVNITIKDIKQRVPEIKMIGFLIEDEESLADRIESKPYNAILHSQDSCVDNTVDKLSMFQYMIGNTDWYINTRHNTDIFQKKESGELIPVAYDFDFAGVINTNYAVPSKEIPITQVKQRYFKGSCRDFEAYNPTLELFNNKKDEIFALYHSFEYLPKNVIKKSLRYYDKFYEIINDPESVNDSFYSVCKSPFDLQSKN